MLRVVVCLSLGALVGCAAAALPPDPAAAPVIAVLRSTQCELRVDQGTWCERVTDAGQWRELRQRLGGAVSELPDDWCDFEHDCVVILVAAGAPAGADFAVRTLEEEGVDVVVATQVGPAGDGGPLHSACLLLALPRRPAQLAVVLRQQFGTAPGTESTVRVFAGSRQAACADPAIVRRAEGALSEGPISKG